MIGEGRKVFKAGGCCTTDNWRFYDSYIPNVICITRKKIRVMVIIPIVRADKLSGALLICHGVVDDNVHPQNTFEYAEALVQADKDFKDYYTDRNHGISGGNTRNHLLRQR